MLLLFLKKQKDFEIDIKNYNSIVIDDISYSIKQVYDNEELYKNTRSALLN